MPLANPEQTVVDLRTKVPPGWTISGLSAPKFDGVNFYRTPQAASEIRFSTTGPRFIAFAYQLFSPNQAVQARVTLDGQLVGEPVFPAGQFTTVYPGGFAPAGAHVLRLEQSCAAPCPINQYYAGVRLTAVLPPQRSAGSGAVKWLLDVPQPGFSVSGLSAVKFDGVNYFRELGTLQPVDFRFLTGSRATDLYTQTFSDRGAYQLRWTLADGSLVNPRPVLPAQSAAPAVLPAGVFLARHLPLIRPKQVQGIRLQVSCADSSANCLPIRFYWTELTTLTRPGGLADFSVVGLLGIGALTLALLLLFAALFRPARDTS